MNPLPAELRVDTALPQHNVAGLRLDYLTPDDIAQSVIARAGLVPGFCCVQCAHQCIEVYKDPKLAAAVSAATLRVSDSKILDLARQFLHGVDPLPTLKGADLMIHLARAAASAGKRIGFFGGTEETIAKLVDRLPRHVPGCEVGYACAPPFGSLSDLAAAEYAKEINRSNIQILFVGLGCPKQEWWMYRNRQLVEPFMVGVGAAFDFVAGTKRPSPPWVHRNGLEWLYRFLQEPRRLWRRYVIDAPFFLWLVVEQKLTRGRQRRPWPGAHPAE